jgi:hypothetical protein
VEISLKETQKERTKEINKTEGEDINIKRNRKALKVDAMNTEQSDYRTKSFII